MSRRSVNSFLRTSRPDRGADDAPGRRRHAFVAPIRSREDTTMQTSESRTRVAPRASAPRTSWIFFAVLGVVVVLVSTLGQFSSSVSGLAEVRDDNWIVATFGTGMGVLTLAVAGTALRRAEPWAWWALCYYPVFFAVHVAVFGTWIPDAVLLVLSVAALAVSARAVLGVRPA
jgi:hypothetical protein